MSTEFFDEHALYTWEFKNKGYAHFDTEFCKSRVYELLASLKKTKRISHKFYPLIRFTIPKYKKDENGRIYIDKKNPRYIMHTARIDANIYSFYRNLLMNKYEDTLKKLRIADCVIAYRKIPMDCNIKKGKCNVHFANEAIEEINKKMIKFSRCSAIAMDIKGFFDNLNHDKIKSQWCRVMGFANRLPDDHYTIYKNITRFKYIDMKSLEDKLNFKFSALRKANKKQICTPEIFRDKVRPYLSEKNKYGIPQGTTISDVIANIYMLDFDTLMKKFADKYDGYYRRYSDDILLICPTVYQTKAIQFIKWLVKRTGKTLCINDKKTLVSNFEKTENGIECTSYKNSNGKLEIVGKPFEYLGLSFNGICKRIRQSTISAFYDKLSERIKVEVKIAREKLIARGNFFPDEEALYKMVSFERIRNCYMQNRDKKENKNFLGNFYTYVQLVANVTGNQQVRNIFDGLGQWIKERARKYCKSRLKKIHFDCC